METILTEIERNSLFSSLADATPDIIALFELPEGKAKYLNSAGLRCLSPDRLPNLEQLGLTSIIGPTSLDQFREEILPQVQMLGNWSGVIHLRDTLGSEFRLHATFLSEPILSQKNRMFLHAIAVVEGVVEGTAIAEHELLPAMLEALPECVYFKDLSGRFIRISRAMAQKFKLSDPDEAIGKTDFDYFKLSHAVEASQNDQAIISSGHPILEVEEEESFDDGRIGWVSICRFPFRDLQGKLIGTFGVSRDISANKLSEQDRRRIESRLQLAQKLESVGRLASGIAHEINTPTQFIADNGRFLSTAFSELSHVLDAYRSLNQQLKHDPTYARQIERIEQLNTENDLDYLIGEIPRALEQSLEGIGRIGRIVGSLKEFSHSSSVTKQPANLNRCIETAIAVSRHEWKYVAEITTELDPELPLVPCVLDKFSQAVLNLIVNAAHTVGDRIKGLPAQKGRITLRTRSEKDWAIVEVEDTGTGISPEVRAHIFEPFFTTKGVGKGTGQGLAIVHTIIAKEHQGQVDFITEVGVGTKFILKLPLSSAPEAVSSVGE